MPPITPRTKPISQPLPTSMLSNEKMITIVPPVAGMPVYIKYAPTRIMIAKATATPPKRLSAIPVRKRYDVTCYYADNSPD
jgi:hypothetical protein